MRIAFGVSIVAMARSILYVPPGGGLFHVTTRTVHGRFLLRPGVRFNALAAGVLGRAQRKHQVEIHAAVILSNHYHLLISVGDAQQLASFMCFFNGNLAREAGRLYGWRERIWSRRYRSTLVSDEPEAQVDRLRYLLAQGCKEGLVESPLDWPGVSCVSSLLEGQELSGVWVNRTKACRLSQGTKTARRSEFEKKETVRFSKLPCWKHLETDDYQARVRDLVESIIDETAKMHSREGTRPLGARAVRRQLPHDHPKRPAKSLAPRFHAVRRSVRTALMEAYREFVRAYRIAAERLKLGHRRVVFPEGCFPPRLPFVPRLEPG